MTLAEAVKGTYAAVGQEMTDMQLALTVADLSEYPPENVLMALTRCRRELRRISLADILDRIPGGRPGVEEAWAIVSQTLKNEQVSIVWTDEMRIASGVAAMLASDPIAARMAFKEKYTELVHLARVEQVPITWTVSLGWEKAGREVALQEAVQKNQISAAHAARLLPPPDMAEELPAVQSLAQVKGMPA